MCIRDRCCGGLGLGGLCRCNVCLDRLLALIQHVLDGLPKSDVLKFLLEDNCSIVVRPSGTCLLYTSLTASTSDALWTMWQAATVIWVI